VNRAFFGNLLLGFLLAGGVAIAAGQTQAAPTESLCRGAAPAVGQILKGPILHVVDGERLCVALDADPETWVEVQVLDAPLQKAAVTSPRTRGTLMAAAFAQNATCEIKGVVDGVPTADCQVEGEPLSTRLASPEIVRIGQAWR
jgi:hypothetical protein